MGSDSFFRECAGMEQQIMERFPGIGCAWVDSAGKEAAETFSSLVAESIREIKEYLNTLS